MNMSISVVRVNWEKCSISNSHWPMNRWSSVSCPKSNGELRDLGFTKLVKRDDGVYENVTARDGDSRYMERGKPQTIPDLSKTIAD